MQNLEDLKGKIFFEAKNILDNLIKINSVQEFLLKRELIEELSDRVSFLKILEKNENYFEPDKINLIFDNQNIEFKNKEDGLPKISEKEKVEEEVLFTNELNGIHKDNTGEIQSINESTVEIQNPKICQKHEFESDIEIEPSFIETHELEAEISKAEKTRIPQVISESKQDIHLKTIEEKEKILAKLEEKRRNIVQFKKNEELENPATKPIIEVDEKLVSIQKEHREKAKKIHLANIKGLKSAQNSLFDLDPLKNIDEQSTQESVSEEKDLVKVDTPTNSIGIEKAKQEFKLDLNDQLAFTKMLFRGRQNELDNVIQKLNSFKTLEEAKEYLSDLYYEKNWQKVDEYAQRLWTLVENKFL